MRANRENKWSRMPSANPTATEIDFFRLVAEDEGDQERAEKMLGKQLDAELIAAGQAAFLAEWTVDKLAAARAAFNAAKGTIAEREKATGLKLADIQLAKTLHGIK